MRMCANTDKPLAQWPSLDTRHRMPSEDYYIVGALEYRMKNATIVSKSCATQNVHFSSFLIVVSWRSTNSVSSPGELCHRARLDLSGTSGQRRNRGTSTH